jgi:hypothetical protein
MEKLINKITRIRYDFIYQMGDTCQDKQGYIYLIELATHGTERLFKVGHTDRPFIERLMEYKCGSPRIILVVATLKSTEYETLILRRFRKQFSQHTTGREYFTGNPQLMKHVIHQFFLEVEDDGEQIDDLDIICDNQEGGDQIDDLDIMCDKQEVVTSSAIETNEIVMDIDEQSLLPSTCTESNGTHNTTILQHDKCNIGIHIDKKIYHNEKYKMCPVCHKILASTPKCICNNRDLVSLDQTAPKVSVPLPFLKPDTYEHIMYNLPNLLSTTLQGHASRCVSYLIEQTNGNPDLPIYNSIKIPNKKEKYIQVSNGMNYVYILKEDVINKLIKNKRNILLKYISVNPDNLDEVILRDYECYIDGGRKEFNGLEDRISCSLLNISDMIGTDEWSQRLLNDLRKWKFFEGK